MKMSLLLMLLAVVCLVVGLVVIPVEVLVVRVVALWTRLASLLACSTVLLPPNLSHTAYKHTDFMKSGSGQLGNLLTLLSTFLVVAAQVPAPLIPW